MHPKESPWNSEEPLLSSLLIIGPFFQAGPLCYYQVPSDHRISDEED